MHRIKKPLVWFVLAALIVTMFPPGIVQKAQAAQAANFFIPDDITLRNTSQLSLKNGDPNKVARDYPSGSPYKMYTTTNSTISFTGTYSHVTEDSLKVKSERLTLDASGDWVTDSSQVNNGNISKDATSTYSQKFKVTQLQLFSGFNKITVWGSQNGIGREDVFYVLYDQIPYIQELKLNGSSYGAIYLNEGSEVVADKPDVSISGDAKNATEVSINVNGTGAQMTTLTQTGKFFSPALNLKPGQNNVVITIKSGADSVTIDRSIYYFDKTKPFDALEIEYNGKDYDVNNKNVAIITEIATPPLPVNGKLKFSVLLNDTGNKFANSGTLLLTDVKTGQTYNSFTVTKETEIPAPNGTSKAFRIVEVEGNFNFNSGDQEFALNLQYDGTYSTSVSIYFKYLPGEVGITGVKYIRDSGITPTINAANVSSLPDLDGTILEEDHFYIVVSSDQNFTPTTLNAMYMPKGSSGPALSNGTYLGTDGSKHHYLYRVTGFSTGRQQVKFVIGNSSASKTVTVSYATKNYINVEGLYDGQVISIDSSLPPTERIVKLEVEYRDFENLSNPEFFVNGVHHSKLSTPIPFNPAPNTKVKFDLPIDISGPLFYGENRIKFVGVSQDGKGNSRTVVKELRVYIQDTNVSSITTFLPKVSDPTVDFSLLKLDDTSSANDVLNKVLANSPEFQLVNGIYETSSPKFDLVIQGAGAKIINLMLGTDVVFSSRENGPGNTDLSTDLTDPLLTSTKLFLNEKISRSGKPDLYYDLAVYKGQFVLRIKDIPLDMMGSKIYNLELINSTGARTTQRIEISKVLAPYRILSPAPTVGNDIIVNKNFVRFDIEAEGATRVLFGKEEATKRLDLPQGSPERFIYDYVGLKPDKKTQIKITIERGTQKLNETVEVYYTSAVAVDSQFMTEKAATKYSAFNKSVELSFPKGTVLQTANVPVGSVTKFYPDNKILFGIADPNTGIVERRNDYGNFFNIDKDERTPKGANTLILPEDLVALFNSTAKTSNFTRVSNVYWINGGYGESNSNGLYKPATNGLPPYSILPQYSDSQTFQNLLTREPERKLVPSQRGTLKLSFDKNVVDEAGTTVTVFRFNEKGEWENLGGAVDNKNKTITVPFDDFGYYMVMKQSRGYNDITNHPWGRNLLNALYAKGIMTNVLPNSFGADDLTTRGEFATLLVKGLNIPLNYDNNVQTYFDVVPGAKTDTWDFKHIETASRAGIITGISEGYFGVEEPLTREQAALMVARALKLKLAVNDSKLNDALAKQFLDSGKIDPYARPAVQAVYKAKIMDGEAVTPAGGSGTKSKKQYNFNPKNNLTRAEAGKIAVELLKKSKSNIFPKNLS